MSDTDALRRARPIWPWVLFGLALGFHAWVDVAEGAGFGLLPSYFLPLLTGWLAYTHGWRVVNVLIALALPVLVSVSWSITETLRVWWGIWADGYLLGIGTAVAFAGPWRAAPVVRFLQPWWRASLWVAFALLWLLVTVVPEIDLVESQMGDGLALSLTIPALLGVAAASVRWREITASVPQGSPRALAVLVGLVLLALLSLRTYFDVSEIFGIRIGGVAAGEALLVLGFLVAAWRILDWRALALLLVALAGAHQLWQTFSPATDPVHHGSPVTAISAVVLGAALSPFWLSRGAEAPSASRSVRFVLLLLALQVLELPGNYDGFVVGGIAFLGGLVWRFRSLVAMPLVLQLAHALCCLRGEETSGSLYSLPSSLVTIGAVAFFFAFFGLLSNRFAAEDELAPPPRALEAAT